MKTYMTPLRYSGTPEAKARKKAYDAQRRARRAAARELKMDDQK